MKLQNSTKLISILTLLFLTATFEHNYSTLRAFSGDLKWMQINISAISTAFLVLGIDLSILMSIIHLVSTSGFNVNKNKWPARWILFMSVSLSGVLNVHYMLTHAPDDSLFSLLIAICVGAFIPIMLLLLGWLEETTVNNSNLSEEPTRKIINKRIRQRLAVSSSFINTGPELQNGKLTPLKQRILHELNKDNTQSNRAIARKIGCSPTTVSRVRNQI